MGDIIDKMLERSVQLDRLATRYIWWESIDWAYAHPAVFLSNVMNVLAQPPGNG